MTVDERLAQLEASVAALVNETPDQREKRESRNAEQISAALRSSIPDPARLARTSQQNELRKHLAGEEQGLTWKAEIEDKLRAHDALPEPRGAGQESRHKLDRQMLTDTLAEILFGIGRMSPGNLREMARRDGVALDGQWRGLEWTQRRIAELRAELETVG